MPINKRLTGDITSTNVWVAMTDDATGLAFLNSGPNVILDIVNDPDPAAGNRYEIALYRNGIDTGVRWFSTSISPASAGRLRPTPVKLKGGQYQFYIRQTAGTAADHSVVVQFDQPL